MLKLVKKEDCSTKSGMRKSDRKKLEDKKKEVLATKEIARIIEKTKDKYVYTTVWDNQQNRQKRTRIYLKNKDLE